MKYSMYKKYSNLFNRINNELDGNRYYSASEVRENEKNFIYSIIYRDYNALLYYIDNLEDGACDIDVIKDVKNVMYKMSNYS